MKVTIDEFPFVGAHVHAAKPMDAAINMGNLGHLVLRHTHFVRQPTRT